MPKQKLSEVDQQRVKRFRKAYTEMDNVSDEKIIEMLNIDKSNKRKLDKFMELITSE